jgi:20S proteasome alpha/beta subunit
MTTVAAMICSDGLVMGSDTKVVGGDIKYSQNKIEIFCIGKSPLLIGGAGSLRHCKDAIRWMRLDSIDDRLGKDKSFNHFLDIMVESTLPDFVNDFKIKYGDEPDLEMLIGSIDEDGKPRIVQIYPDGDYDHMDSYCSIGSGGIFGEILLRKLYFPEVTVEFAKKLIGYIIWEIQEIDNYSGEDMQIVCIGCDKKRYDVPKNEISAYKELPKLIHQSYDTIKTDLALTDIPKIAKAIESMHETINKAKL